MLKVINASLKKKYETSIGVAIEIAKNENIRLVNILVSIFRVSNLTPYLCLRASLKKIIMGKARIKKIRSAGARGSRREKLKGSATKRPKIWPKAFEN